MGVPLGPGDFEQMPQVDKNRVAVVLTCESRHVAPELLFRDSHLGKERVLLNIASSQRPVEVVALSANLGETRNEAKTFCRSFFR